MMMLKRERKVGCPMTPSAGDDQVMIVHDSFRPLQTQLQVFVWFFDVFCF